MGPRPRRRQYRARSGHWLVKNVFVIASLRPSVSDTLTAQTLGRGLRLPYGEHTGEELLDTLEVLSHDRYERLLASAGVLIKGITNVRILEPPTSGVGATQPPGGQEAARVDVLVPEATVVVTYGGHGGSTGSAATPPDDGAPMLPGMVPGDTPDGFIITTAAAHIGQATASADAVLAVPALAERPVSLPRVTRTMGVPNFSLSDIDDSVFADLGRKVAGAHTAQLDRKLLEVVDDGQGGFTLIPRQGAAIDASVVNLPLGGIRTSLIQTIMNLDFVPDDEAARNGAARLVDAAITTAGGEDKLATYHQAAAKLIQRTLRSKFKTTTPVESQTITVEPFAKGRTTHYRREPNRYGNFDRHAAYGPWERSTHAYNWFDSEPERKLANLLDADLGNDDVQVWCRILRGEFSIAWAGGTYTPDFYARVAGVHYLLEVKADRDVSDDEVQAKKGASKRLARAVSDEGTHGAWRYLLISEDDLRNIKNVGDLLRIADD
jgi:type III restriction enzyme